jgi:outer membrane autotransporter protein
MFNARIHQTSGRSRTGLLVGVAAAVSLFAATGAQAQNCVIGGTPFVSNLGSIGSSPASISSMIASSITTASTAFLLQSTAFIGSPANPAPEQQGGGVWVRGVGGSIEVKSTTTTTASQPFPPGSNATITCSQTVHEDFAGVQLGADIARLNINGWNLHFGTTAGYLESRGHIVGGAFAFSDAAGAPGNVVGGGPFNNTTQVPFFGGYAAATYGGFFVDALVRAEYYQTNLNAPGIDLFNQSIDAHGVSFSSSIGYNWRAPDSKWFVEPSAGVIISRIKVDPFNYVTAGISSPVFSDQISGTLQLQDIKSDIGRVGLRVGTTVESGNMVWQPFAAVSVWHEFGPNANSNFATCPGLAPGQSCAFFGGAVPVIVSAASSTSTFGTFGQYSLGVSGQVVGTGWLGFARVDYRDGPNLQGLSGTGGIRYQFTPDVRPVMPVKAPVYKAPIIEAVNWTGVYIGGFGSADLGDADWGFPTGIVKPHIGGYDVGGNVGYNWQNGRVVVGLEGALEKTNLNGGTACGPLAGNFAFGSAPTQASPMFQMTCNAWANWIAEATARVGFTWDRALFYAKLGGAWTNEQFSATCNLGPLQAFFAANTPGVACVNPAKALSSGLTASIGRAGWLVGYGTEFALTRNWSAKAEANYVNFGDKNVTASDGSLLNLGMSFVEVKVGVNYRFDGGPVVARY